MVHIAPYVGIYDDPVRLLTGTSVIIALMSGDLLALWTYIKLGADVDEPNKEGLTPLHIAATMGSERVVDLLIRAGCAIPLEGASEKPLAPVTLAKRSGHHKVSAMIMAAAAGEKIEKNRLGDYSPGPIHTMPICVLSPNMCATHGNLQALVMLVGYGCYDADFKNENGMTALTKAVITGHMDMVKYLLSIGCDMNVVDNGGRYLTHHALMNGHPGIYDFLRSCGCESEKADDEGSTPFRYFVAYVSKRRN